MAAAAQAICTPLPSPAHTIAALTHAASAAAAVPALPSRPKAKTAWTLLFSFFDFVFMELLLV
jgi:hypothetical protein